MRDTISALGFAPSTPGARRRAVWTLLLLAPLIGCSDDGPSGPPEEVPPTVDQFKTSASCGTCHPNHYAEWRRSMHAYSVQDPVWQRVRHLEYVATGGRVGAFCASCHAQVGFLTGAIQGDNEIAGLPEVVQDGVGCVVCHQTTELHPADENGGHPVIVPGDTVYGQLTGTVETSAHVSVQNLLMERSLSCMPCHDFIARGVEFEPTFTEWNRSSYAVRLECQACHMEKYTGRAAVGGPVRDNLTRHDFPGVDLAMTPFPDQETAAARVEEILKNAASLLVDLPASAAPGAEMTLPVRVVNDRTGHYLPSGVSFAREVWLEVTVTDASGDTIYVSGDRDANGDLRNEHSEIDPGGDPDLMLWTTDVTFEGAEPGVTVFAGTGITGEIIPPDSERGRDYRIPIPANAGGSVHVAVRLLIRAFKPYSLRANGLAHLQAENPIHEMNRFEGVVSFANAAPARAGGPSR